MPRLKDKMRGKMPTMQKEVYTAGHARSFVYMAMPGRLTTIYGLLLSGSISGLAYYFGQMLDPKRGGYFYFVTAVGIMTALSFLGMGVKGIRGKRKQKREAEFEGALKESAGGWGDEEDPAELQRLDDLRANFQKGIDTFREYGKDIYSMPWYVIVGEPGSGKTEAIRHSELKFPEALQDKLQGTGGTYSMHWWFTNHAVILDTAGAMLMNEAAGERFEEFLKLLRSWRKECPVNGMILTIPVDSLLMDDLATAEDKARTISEQLIVIQKTLDIRFPIYLMITKSDRLPGFREFCDAPAQEKFDRQMVGWSNPAELDSTFQANAIDEALAGLALRLRNRRLALLSDPISRTPGARRLDEVDALYTFPDTVASLAPRLRRYLEIIFQTGEWAKRPPFFRGLYFTSAMREGSTLDEELAAALGMPIQQLPQGGVWTGQKSVFLRDLFMEKIFQERGLITRLKDIARSLRRRLAWLYGTVGILLALLLGSAFLVKRGIDRDLADDERFWSAANDGWDNGRFLALLDRKERTPDGLPQWTWAADGVTRRADSTRLQLLQRVEQKSRDGISGGWVFRPLPRFREMERERRFAYQTLFEGAVIKPVLDAAREKLAVSAELLRRKGGTADEHSARALAALVELEAVLGDRSLAPFPETEFRSVFEPLLKWACPETIADPEAVVSLAKLTYNDDFRFADRTWMSQTRYLQGLQRGGRVDESQAPIQSGLSLLFATEQNVVQDAAKLRQLREDLLNAAARFDETEKRLFSLAKSKEIRDFNTIYNLAGPKGELDERLAALTAAEKASGGVTVTMDEQTWATVMDSLKNSVARATALATEERPVPSGVKLVADKLKKPRQSSGANAGETADQRLLESEVLGGLAGKRAEQYRRFLEVKLEGGGVTAGGLMGAIANPEKPSAGDTGAPAFQYDGARKEEAEEACTYLRSYAPRFRAQLIMADYLKTVLPSLGQYLKFPLVQSNQTMSAADFAFACRRLTPVKEDALAFDEALRARKIPDCKEALDLSGRFSALTPVFQLMDVLYDGKGVAKMKLDLGPCRAAQEGKPVKRPAIGLDGLPMLDRDGRPIEIEVAAPLDPNVTNVEVEYGKDPRDRGNSLHTGAPGETRKALGEVDANNGVRISVRGNLNNQENQPYGTSPANWMEEWGAIREILKTKGDSLTLSLRNGKTISLYFNFAAPLPASWPQRSSFPWLKD